jgi:hypothetical protein
MSRFKKLSHVIWHCKLCAAQHNLHSQTVCAKFFFIICSFLNDGHRISAVAIVQKEFLVKYYSIAFAILPSIAGGLALKLLSF